MIYGKPNYAKSCVFGGDNRYTELFSKLPIYVDLPIDTYSEIFKKQITKLVEIIDLDQKYNTVGLPIHVKIWS